MSTNPIRLGALTLDPPTALAPMAGVTDAAFRAQVRSFGAGLVVSEMVTAAAYLSGKADVGVKARLAAAERAGAASVQIAGRERAEIAEAARRAAGEGAPVVDVNMGCPPKKVTSGAAGAALMRDPDLAIDLLEAAMAAVDTPVTVKMRLGWDDASLTAAVIAARAEAAGVAMVAVHARTRAQFYKGAADWRRARAVREAIRIPLLINGDIDGPDAARRALAQSGADGVMIGRAACGRPWLLAEIGAALHGRAFRAPAPCARAELAAEYYEAALLLHGRDVGRRAARKHLAWRVEAMGLGAAEAAALKREMTTLEDPDAVLDRLRALAERLWDAPAPQREAA